MSTRTIPDALESLLIRRVDTARYALACDICGKPSRWRVMTRWDVAASETPAYGPASRYRGDGTESLVTYLCAGDGWEFIAALGDNLRAGDP